MVVVDLVGGCWLLATMMGGCGGCGMGGCGCGGWMWRFFFSLLLFVVEIDLAGGGDGGWMWWLWYRWVDVVAGGAENSWVEKERDRGERDREKGRKNNNKEIIFK